VFLIFYHFINSVLSDPGTYIGETILKEEVDEIEQIKLRKHNKTDVAKEEDTPLSQEVRRGEICLYCNHRKPQYVHHCHVCNK
jgi:hypothetical protein